MTSVRVMALWWFGDRAAVQDRIRLGPVVNWFLLYFQYDGNEYATLPLKPVVFI